MSSSIILPLSVWNPSRLLPSNQDERKAKLQRLQELRAEEAKLDAELSKFSASDPERIQKLSQSISLLLPFIQTCGLTD